MDPEPSLEMPSTHANYRHEPLDTTKQQIRLLKVQKDQDGPVQCLITTFDMETAPTYRTLSYMWGSPEPACCVLVQGDRLPIRSNLHRFLLNIRREKEDDWLWIDQICIDQSSTTERNHQVRLMSEIYSQGQSMIIWLSDDLGLVAMAGRDFRADPDMPYDTGYSSLITLLHNPYFGRLWIVQEILLARSISVLTDGNCWTRWGLIRASVTKKENMFNIDDFDEVISLLLLSHQSRRLNHSFKSILEEFSSNVCEDPRDRVYGLMSLVAKSEQIEVDYSKTRFEVYIEAVVAVNRFPSRGYNSFDPLWTLAANMSIRRRDRESLELFLNFMSPPSDILFDYGNPHNGGSLWITAVGVDKSRNPPYRPLMERRLSEWTQERSERSCPRRKRPDQHTKFEWDLVKLIKAEGSNPESRAFHQFREEVTTIGNTGVWYYVYGGELHDFERFNLSTLPDTHCPDWKAIFSLPIEVMQRILKG